MRKCLDKITIPSLAAEIKAKITDKMTDSEIREIGTQLALKHQEGLNKSLNDLRKQVGLKKSDIKVNDKKAERKAVEDEFTGKKKDKVKVEKQTSAKEIKNYEQKKLRNAVNKIDPPQDARGTALAYLAGGGTIGDKTLNEVVKQRKSYGRVGKTLEAKDRNYYDVKNQETIDDLAHGIWEHMPESAKENVDTQDVKNALLDVFMEFNNIDDARKEFIDKYGEPKERILDDEDISHFQKLYEENEAEEFAAVQKAEQDYIDDLKNLEDEFGESPEFIESLIKQYNDETGTSKGTEIKDSSNEAGSKGEADKKISNREVDEKDKSREGNARLASGIEVEGSSNTLEQYTEKAQAVLSQLYPDHKIIAHETEGAYYADGKKPSNSYGYDDPDTKTIHLNIPLIKKLGGDTTPVHEVIHPIVREALESREGGISEAYDQIKAREGEKELESIWAHQKKYADRGASEKQQKIEVVTEFLTQVVNNKIDPTKLSYDLSTKIIDIVNKIFKALGIDKVISTPGDLRKLAESIKESFDKADAKAVADVLGKRKEVSGEGNASLADVRNEAESTIKEYPELSRQEIIDEYKEFLSEEEINRKREVLMAELNSISLLAEAEQGRTKTEAREIALRIKQLQEEANKKKGIQKEIFTANKIDPEVSDFGSLVNKLKTQEKLTIEAKTKVNKMLSDLNQQALEDAAEKGAEESKEEKARIEKARQEYLKGLKKQDQDENNLLQFRLQRAKELNQEIVDDENQSLDDRTESFNEAMQLELSILENATEQKLKEISRYDDTVRDLSDAEIQRLISGLEIKKQLTTEERLLLEQLTADKEQLLKKQAKDRQALIDSEVIKSKKQVDDTLLAQDTELKNALEAENLKFAALDATKEAIEEHERQVFEIKKMYALKALQEQVKAAEALLLNSQISADERKKIENNLANAKFQISELGPNTSFI